MASSKDVRWRAADLFDALKNKRLTIAIDHVLPLERAAEAHQMIEARSTRGKLLFEISVE